MGRYTGRLLFALILSSSGFFGTTYWYEKNQAKSFSSQLASREPIAILQQAVKEVQKKSSRKIIWEDISKDESLFSGESLRTASDAEARILFIKSNTIIELDPDSLIVLEESPKGLTLNFLKGNLFIKNSKNAPIGEGGQKLVLKSGNNEINVKNSSLSLSKSKSGTVNLDVFEGSAAIKGNDGKINNIDNTKSGILSSEGLKVSEETIQILSPTPNVPVYIDPTQNQKLHIKWKKLSKDYSIHIESGRRRSKLKRNQKLNISAEKGEVHLKSKLGKFYWQLVATPKPGKPLPILKSKVLPLQIIAKIPPKLIYPNDNEKIILQADSPDIQLKWTNQSKLKKLFLEISKEPDFKNKIFERAVSSKNNSLQIELRDQGTYFWRVTGYMKIKDKFEGLSSKIKMFKIGVIEDINPPTLRFPLIGKKLSYKIFQKNGLVLKWDREPGAIRYKIKLIKAEKKGTPKSSKKKEISFYTEDNKYKVTDLKLGWHYWSVATEGKSKKLSKFGKPQTFKLFDLPKIIWSSGSAHNEYLYITEKPSFKINWRGPEDKKITEFRIKYALESRFSNEKKWVHTKFNELKKYVPNNGSYSFLVEGISANNRIIARSDVKTMYIKNQKRLQAPLYHTEMPEIIKSNKRGDLQVKWQSVDGAKEYVMQLRTVNGDILKESSFTGTNGNLNGLNPGLYKVTLLSVDRFNRKGPIGDERQVDVPNTSNIKAPSLKGIKIK